MNISIILNSLLTFIFALIAMAFYTLLERKTLSLSQRRKGPNKPSFSGVPQPLADAMKLLTKEMIIPNLASLYPFISAPLISLSLSMFMWALYPSYNPSFFIQYGILLFICISSINIYTTLLAGWISNSKFALFGALRSIAQSISYEVSMMMILLNLLIYTQIFDLNLMNSLMISWLMLCSLPLFFAWIITILAETNRAPFDFAEGESELVSGFNTEFSGLGFTLIFMSEYLSIMFISLISSLILIGNINMFIVNNMFLMFKLISFMFLFLWVRTSYPRLRYDQLMNLTWTTLLPFSLSMFMIITPLLFLLLHRAG